MTFEGVLVRCCNHERDPGVLGGDLLVHDSPRAALSCQNVLSAACVTFKFSSNHVEKK